MKIIKSCIIAIVFLSLTNCSTSEINHAPQELAGKPLKTLLTCFSSIKSVEKNLKKAGFKIDKKSAEGIETNWVKLEVPYDASLAEELTGKIVTRFQAKKVNSSRTVWIQDLKSESTGKQLKNYFLTGKNGFKRQRSARSAVCSLNNKASL